MNKIGIGELRHAKPLANTSSAPTNPLKQAVLKKLRASRRPQEKLSQAPEEGQLSVDIVQREDQMIVICPIAGVEKGDIKVAIQDDVLTIRGERKALEGIQPSEALIRELFWGTFSRSIVLPDHIDRKNIQAEVREAMLIITIPKTEDFKSRIIHIKEE